MNQKDEYFMKEAIKEAYKCVPTKNAFCVGAVIVKNGKIESRGFSRELPNNTHAEECALIKLPNIEAAINAEIYTTMEPCSTRLSGKLSCVDRIIRSGIKRVIFGVKEPNTFVKCTGISILEKHGIEVKNIQEIEEECLNIAQQNTKSSKSIGIELERKSPIIILPPLQQNSQPYKGKLPRGISFCNNNELFAVFDACVSTGDLSRAYVLLDHLSHDADPSFIIQIHNRYLQVLVEEIKKTGDFENANKCFHNLEQKYSIVGDETTFALMLKAALYIKDQEESRITINGFNKLWRLKKKENIGKIFSENSILTHQEILKLFEIMNINFSELKQEYRHILKSIANVEKEKKTETSYLLHPLESIPELLPTNISGPGLQLLKKSLRPLTDPNVEINYDIKDFPEECHSVAFNMARQRLLEENALDTALERWKWDHEQLTQRGGLKFSKTLNPLLFEWHSLMMPLIKEEIERYINLSKIFNDPRQFQSALQKTQNSVDFEIHPKWPTIVKAKIGSILISILMHVAKIDITTKTESGDTISQEVPAFYHTYQYQKGRKLGVIKLNDYLMKQLVSQPLRGNIHPRLLPMLVEPKPWISWDSGGYYLSKSIVMRSRDSPEQIQYLKIASERNNLKSIFEGLDVLGSTAWAINKPVFDVIIEVWNSGLEFAEIPSAQPNIIFPPRPTSKNPADRISWQILCKQIARDAQNKQSIRCDINYKLEIARAFLHEKMYFPHNLDFRGRAYPIPPHFNHLGNDLCRGLLTFHEAKEIGESGLRWLKIHLANVCGFDKESFMEREAFTVENLENIFDSADNPLNGSRWWLKFDDPWQTLAACFELTAALRFPDPYKFKSRLPVHQDGTCNGLQHYAALGGDISGARQVNLEPSNRPYDVYTRVAELVNDHVQKDAKEGNHLAILLKDKISRKIVKQTVMTNVYGVTYVGARNQILNQLKDLNDLPKEMLFNLASYLAKIVFLSLKSMFTGAHKIQEWLNEAARRISKSINTSPSSHINHMTSVIWTSPLNLPIVQPYRKSSRKQIKTNLQSIFITDPNDMSPVDTRKQQTAFPPNFIHSLDATHMLMSAVSCKNAGLTFASVHDSYWTHAADIDNMNVILRETFVKLHEENIMENLLNEFQERYKGYKTLISVSKNSKEGKKILSFRKEKSREIKLNSLNNNNKPEIYEEFNDLNIEDDEQNKHSSPVSTQEQIYLNTTNINSNSSEKEIEEAEKTNIKNETKKKDLIHVWVDLEFPPLPKKGDFDVRNLRNKLTKELKDILSQHYHNITKTLSQCA
ncbi:hypothetical protein PORY_001173 [Pneumocystis oryctolagi]|uniref:Uncharacterized protein n=1 Tax=Pneumocystis oryctolagi TaxID=42067 RepID=A0ACB7CEV6_9ASCO|nr:hypothetical protein PORY_001173 [Pneumocystis oryctolagi]